MPARDRHHLVVKRALEKSGWVITHDPRTLLLPERLLYIDLRAVHLGQQIAVLIEVKGFEQPSQIEALVQALGKYNLYRSALKINGIDEMLYLAIPEIAYTGIISETLGKQIITDYEVKLVVFDPDAEEIIQWIP
jgi:hypothetical protein